MHLLMEKQRNRGQDGAGVANVKLDMAPGTKYIHCEKSIAADAWRPLGNRWATWCDLVRLVEKHKTSRLRENSLVG
jgi:hypothetical protein